MVRAIFGESIFRMCYVRTGLRIDTAFNERHAITVLGSKTSALTAEILRKWHLNLRTEARDKPG